MKKQPENRTAKSQGMNWISQHKRLAIYLRDGLACCYCGTGVTEGAKLTLDHLKPYSKGGSNKETNLVTCCLKCNSSRGNRPVASFVKATAAYINHGVTADGIMKHIKNTSKRVLNITLAKELIAAQGSCFNVVSNHSK